jgi:hypothetical protein
MVIQTVKEVPMAELERQAETARVEEVVHPDVEINHLIARATLCEELAGAGRFECAYRVLVEGLERARELRDGGAVMGDDLVRLWRAALDDYWLRYGVVSLGGPAQ